MMGLGEAQGRRGLPARRSRPATTRPSPVHRSRSRAEGIPVVVIRLKLQSALTARPFQDTAQLFWQTRQLSESEATSLHFDVRGRRPVARVSCAGRQQPSLAWNRHATAL